MYIEEYLQKNQHTTKAVCEHMGGGNWACDQWKRQKVCDKCKSQLNKKRLTHGKQWVCDKYEINGGVRKKNHL